MRQQRQLLSYVLSVFALMGLVACGNPANPPPGKWTAENPNAASGTSSSAASNPVVAKSDVTPGSSLEALQKGEAAGGGPLKDINFNFDSADLSQTARAILKDNADWLKGNPAVRVQIEGHCDERGAADYNMALGAKRAQAAMDYLATLGVAANRMSTISYGEEIPVCREHTEDCWAKNRRARFVASQTKPTS